jgi:opacity protein-like surface antigen
MRFLILAAAVGAVALPATAADAQYGRGDNGYAFRQRECQRDLRNADSRREYYQIMRECRRFLAAPNRDQWRYGNRYGNRYNDRYRSGYDNGYNRGNYRDNGRYWDGYRWRDRD